MDEELHEPHWPTVPDVPECLYCAWDDDSGREGIASALAAYSAAVPGRWWRATYRGELYVKFQNVVAFLCDACVEDEEILRWFEQTVTSRYPDAVFVRRPGRSGEKIF